MERYVIHVTKECNMNCMYCYEQDKLSAYNWEDIEALIDSIIADNTAGDVYSIEFLGGEPLLEFEYVKDTIARFKEKDPDHVDNYVITTNGTILTDDIITLLKENKNVYFCASIDGTSVMNQLRTLTATGENSYDRVMNNISRLLSEGLGGQVGVHMVIHPFNVSGLHDGIHHFYDAGIRNVSVGTVESTIEIDSVYAKRFIREMGYISEEISKGEMPGLFVDVLEWLKPKSDVRKYIKDASGKTIAETYGRAENDITSDSKYTTISTGSPFGDMIYQIRETVYNNHQKYMNGASK